MKGFLSGSIKGLGSLIIMPISGAIDLVSKTSEGFKNLLATNKR